jgi:hypothetical protein
MTMSEINKLEIRINQLRLDLIKILAEINRMASNIPKATVTPEYKALKAEYRMRQEEIYCLRMLKNEL